MRTPEQICEEAAYRARLIELEALNAELVAALEIVQDFLRHGRWNQNDGVDNFISAALAKAKEWK